MCSCTLILCLKNKNLFVQLGRTDDLEPGGGVGLLVAGKDHQEETVGRRVTEHFLAKLLRLLTPFTLLKNFEISFKNIYIF